MREFEGEIDSGVIKGASGGDDADLRVIYLDDSVVYVTAHMWFMGNNRDEGGARLGITNDDENTRAILGRAKMLLRETIPNPDKTVVKQRTAELDFRHAALARLVQYTMACSKLWEFPPDLPSNRPMQEVQRQAEMADWQQDWLSGVIRPRGPQDTAPEVCGTAVYENFRQWWTHNATGRPPAKGAVTQAVSRRHVKAARGRCPQHGGRVESIFHGYVMVLWPVSLAL